MSDLTLKSFKFLKKITMRGKSFNSFFVLVKTKWRMSITALQQAHVIRCFAIRKVRVTKARFEKNGYGIQVTDLSDTWKYLHMISIQLFFKTGLAILYELHDKKQSCV